MTLHEQADEYLELLYHLREKHQQDLDTFTAHCPSPDQDTLRKLSEQGHVIFDDGQLALTDKGFERAEQIVRRHRLAERLLADVLHMNPAEFENAACEFEHVVAEEIAEGICTLLGHPRTCPHGSPIPEGPCCKAAARECHTAVVSLLEMPVGQWGRIAYVSSGSDERQHHLTHFGVTPGGRIKLHQLKPTVVVVLSDSRLAMEPSVARDIFVWRKWQPDDAEADSPEQTPQPRRRWSWPWSRQR